MLKNCLLATSALVAAFAVAAPAHADSGNLSLADRVRILENELEKSKDYQQDMRTRLTTLESNAKDVQWSYSNGRPTIKSGDGRFKLAFRARLHFDYANYMQNGGTKALESGTVTRRFYFGVEGNVFKDFDYELRFNLGGSDNDGSSNLNIARVAYVGVPHFKVNVGVLQPIFTLDDATSSNDLLFLERAAVVGMLPGTFGGSDSRRGVELTFQHEDLLYPGDNMIVSGAFTGNRTGKSSHSATNDEQQAILGRLAYRVWSDGDSNIQFGGSGSKVLEVGGANGGVKSIKFSSGAETSVDSTSLVSVSVSGDNAWTYGAEAGANFKNFYVQGEYYRFGADAYTGSDPDFYGWYVQTSWIITGEKKGYAAKGGSNSIGVWGSPKVVKPFSPAAGSWGALELKARYSVLDLNDYSAGYNGGVLTSVGGGLNWYLNNNIRMMFDYSYVDSDSPSTGDTDINIFQSRLSFAF